MRAAAAQQASNACQVGEVEGFDPHHTWTLRSHLQVPPTFQCPEVWGPSVWNDWHKDSPMQQLGMRTKPVAGVSAHARAGAYASVKRERKRVVSAFVLAPWAA